MSVCPCLSLQDRWVQRGRGSQPCFLLEGNDPGEEAVMTYAQVLEEVCRVVSAATLLVLWLPGRHEGSRRGARCQGCNAVQPYTLYSHYTCASPLPLMRSRAPASPSPHSPRPPALLTLMSANWLAVQDVKQSSVVAVHAPKLSLLAHVLALRPLPVLS